MEGNMRQEIGVSPRNGTIDFFRFIFCLLIVLTHAQALAPGLTLVPGGYIGVEFFFIVSGYLMADHIKKTESGPKRSIGTETVRFLGNKLRKIMPYYTVAFCVGFLLQAWVSGGITPGGLFGSFLGSVPALLLLESSGVECAYVLPAAWYLSAMMLSMLALYPLARRDLDAFCKVAAPIAVILFMGWASRTVGCLYMVDTGAWFIRRGLLRGVAGICLGCVCYAAAEALGKASVSRAGAIALTVTELSTYAAVLFLTQYKARTQLDFTLFLMLAGCVTLSFSGKTLSTRLLGNRISAWLGRFSLPLYLGHATILWICTQRLERGSVWGRVMLFLLLSVAAAAFLMLAAAALKRFGGRIFANRKNAPQNAKAVD